MNITFLQKSLPFYSQRISLCIIHIHSYFWSSFYSTTCHHVAVVLKAEIKFISFWVICDEYILSLSELFDGTRIFV